MRSGRMAPVPSRRGGESGMCGGEAGDRNTIRRAGHVVHAERMAKRDRARFTAMLSADAHLQRLTHATSGCDGELDQLTDAFLVKHLERIVRKNASLHVIREEATRVVAGQAKCSLRQVVCSKGKELRRLGDFIRR